MGVEDICKSMTLYLRRLSALLLATIAVGCAKLDQPLPTTNEAAGAGFADQELYGVVIRLTQEERSRLTLRAPHLRRFDTQRLMLLDGGIMADFYDNLGAHRAILTANEGEIVEGVNKLSAKGNVIVRSDSGMVLRSEELHYDQAVGRIEADDFVTLVTPFDSLAGYGFSSAPDLTDWEIKNTSGATWRRLERDTTDVDSAK